MKEVDISEFENDMYKYIDEIIDKKECVIVNTKNGDIVIINKEEYNKIIDTISCEL